MCVRCQSECHVEELRDTVYFCAYCSTLTRLEAQRGVSQLEGYLRKWAAFESWLSSRSPAAAG